MFDSGRGLLVRAKAEAGRGGALRWCNDWASVWVSVSCSRDARPNRRKDSERVRKCQLRLHAVR